MVNKPKDLRTTSRSYLPEWIHRLAQTIVDHRQFRIFILSTIIIAGAQVGIETYTEEDSLHEEFFQYMNLVIIIIFTFEALVKILAEGDHPMHYFRDGWNRFDFFILIICIVSYKEGGGFVAVLRMLRLFRVLKLVSALPQLKLLTSALIKSIPSIGNVVILLTLHFYIFGALSTVLFAANDPVHFGTLHLSILSLFRAATLEDWTDMMYINMYGCANYGYDTPELARLCTESTPMPIVSSVFFTVFVLTGSMIILNLFIGVIINGMDEGKTEIMMSELAEKQHKNGQLSIHEEIVMIEIELQRLSAEMKTLNSRLFTLLSRAKGDIGEIK